MQPSRRRFLIAGGALTLATVGTASYWMNTSSSRIARLLRQLAQDARRQVQPAPVRPDPMAWVDNGVTVCWLGHATVLINFYGIRILTDPIFSSRVGVDAGVGTLGPKRYIAPALRFEELPPIDVVLLSHAHMDHFDLATLRRFPRPIFTVSAKDTTDLLWRTRLRTATELGWGEQTTFKNPCGSLQIEAFAVKHWGRRWPNQRERGYNGYILRREGRALIFGGDTAFTPLFAELKGRGPYACAIMPIAAYNPWIRNHCTPEQAVAMATMAGAAHFVPVHHLTFKLSDEPMHEPLERLDRALSQERDRLALSRVGEHFTLS